MISAENLVQIETCKRRFEWSRKYPTRISLVGALYSALKAGLLAEKDPDRAAESKYLELAANPGLDIEGHDVYAIAMHHAKLAGVVSAALRSTTSTPWKLFPSTENWETACYDMGDGKPRRIALVDRWTEDRATGEIYGWRTMGEACQLNETIYMTAVIIGTSENKHRHSAWTKCFRHPKNWRFRFQKRSREDFGEQWAPQWREDSGILTEDWLKRMHEDGCMKDLVHTMIVPVPIRKDEYLSEMSRLTEEMKILRERPPMRLAGCFGFSPCPFITVCHGPKPHYPSQYGFKARKRKNSL